MPRQLEFTLARPTDPVTSHLAAAQQVDRLTAKQEMVLVILREHPNGLHDQALSVACADAYGWSPLASTARSRRHELAVKGQAYDTGRRTLTDTGSQAIIWSAQI